MKLLKHSIQSHIFHYRNKWWLPLLGKINAGRGLKRILLYTDSRGKNIPGHFYYKHYHEILSAVYSVESHLMPHKWTTIPDFLFEYMHNKSWQNDFDLIILHVGIVDFSPRPSDSLRNTIYPSKKHKFDSLFGEEVYSEFLQQDFDTTYEGKPTLNMYSPEMATKFLLPELKKIPNLLWIGGNDFVPNWRGNYWRDRPDNMGIIKEYFKLFDQELPLSLNFLHWTHSEIKEYTYDIVHLNKKGSDLLWNDLKVLMNNVFRKK